MHDFSTLVTNLDHSCIVAWPIFIVWLAQVHIFIYKLCMLYVFYSERKFFLFAFYIRSFHSRNHDWLLNLSPDILVFQCNSRTRYWPTWIVKYEMEVWRYAMESYCDDPEYFSLIARAQYALSHMQPIGREDKMPLKAPILRLISEIACARVFSSKSSHMVESGIVIHWSIGSMMVGWHIT